MICGNNGSFAKITVQDAWLSGEFGESYARKVFGNEVVDALPRYVRGKRAGKIKGKITWRKVEKGGWLSGVGIVPPGKTYAHGIWETPFGCESVLLHGIDATDPEKSKLGLMRPITESVNTPVQEPTPARKLTDEEKTALSAEIVKARASGNEGFAILVEKVLKDNS